MIVPSRERCVCDVFESDMEFIARHTLVKVLHRETDLVEMLMDDPAKVNSFQGGIPGCPEGQPCYLVQEVSSQRAAPVEDGLQSRGIVSDQDVAVEQIAMQKVPDFRTRP